MNQPLSPSWLSDVSWATADRPQAPVVGAVPATHEVAPPSSIAQPGNPGPRGDPASGSVAGATAAAESYYHSHEVLTHPQGSELGDVLTLPPSPLDPPAGPGLTAPEGHYYDPPRNY